MRIRTLILSLLLCIVSASAKDVITKTDGTKLDAKVEEITETLIRYHKASNPTGPVYTIPITSVATILYENGDIDTFNEIETLRQEEVPVTSAPSDEELMRMAESQSVFTPQTGYVSDAELLRMANAPHADELYANAKKYRKIGWIGGGGLVIAGLICGLVVSYQEDNFMSTAGGGLLGCVAGATWCLGFNLKANSLMKQARKAQSYYSTIFENEILQIGDNSLTAGINLMGNRITNSHSLGLSLGLNF